MMNFTMQWKRIDCLTLNKFKDDINNNYYDLTKLEHDHFFLIHVVKKHTFLLGFAGTREAPGDPLCSIQTGTGGPGPI